MDSLFQSDPEDPDHSANTWYDLVDDADSNQEEVSQQRVHTLAVRPGQDESPSRAYSHQ